MPAKSRRKPALPAAHLRLAYSAPPAPAASRSVIDELRRLTMPATKALPFVKLRPNDQPLWKPESYWSVAPTGKKQAGIALGRRYAREAIAAMKVDGNSQLIAQVVEDIIADAVERARSRKARNTATLGFLYELSEAIAAS